MKDNKDNLNFPGLSYYDSSIKEWVKQQIKKSIAEGETDGTIAVNGVDVAIHGLKSAAFKEAGAFEQAGTVNAAKEALIGTAEDVVTADTIHGAKNYADEVASTAMAVVIGQITDAATANTVFGAKKYTDAVANTSKIYVDNSIAAVSNRLGWEEFN